MFSKMTITREISQMNTATTRANFEIKIPPWAHFSTPNLQKMGSQLSQVFLTAEASKILKIFYLHIISYGMIHTHNLSPNNISVTLSFNRQGHLRRD